MVVTGGCMKMEVGIDYTQYCGSCLYWVKSQLFRMQIFYYCLKYALVQSIKGLFEAAVIDCVFISCFLIIIILTYLYCAVVEKEIYI